MPDGRQELGRRGEDLAAEVLRRRGYRIVELNHRNCFGEIDIIAEEGPVLVFVEVKSRRSERRGDPKWAVTPTKRRKISQVALAYLKSSRQTGRRARFDVVAIRPGSDGQPAVEVVRNAFELAYP
jgi:putative endonuclease